MNPSLSLPSLPLQVLSRHIVKVTTVYSADDKESNTAERANKDIGPTIKQEIFTFQELADATENFSQECLIDVGSFGNVYTGKLGETEEVLTWTLLCTYFLCLLVENYC